MIFFRKTRAIERLATAVEALAHLHRGVLECEAAQVRIANAQAKAYEANQAESKVAQAKAWELVEKTQPLLLGMLNGRAPEVHLTPSLPPSAPAPQRLGSIAVGHPGPVATVTAGPEE